MVGLHDSPKAVTLLAEPWVMLSAWKHTLWCESREQKGIKSSTLFHLRWRRSSVVLDGRGYEINCLAFSEFLNGGNSIKQGMIGILEKMARFRHHRTQKSFLIPKRKEITRKLKFALWRDVKKGIRILWGINPLCYCCW